MAKTQLPASVHRRMRAQGEFSQSLKRGDVEQRKAARRGPFITLSRQYGCMAYEAAERAAEELERVYPDWPYVVHDRRSVEQLAERESIAPDVFHRLSERTRGKIEDWAVNQFTKRPVEVSVYRRLARAMCTIAEGGQAIIVGRGGAAITRAVSNGVHVRLIAPIAWRVENLSRYPDRTEESSLDFVRRADREREGFVQKYLGVDVNDPELYDMILNAATLSMDEQVDMVVALAREKVEALETVA